MMNKDLKQKLKKNLGGMAALALTLGIIGGTSVMAGSKTGTYYLPKNSYTQDGGGKTTTNQYVRYRVDSVYPTGTYTKDNYEYMKISAYHVKNTIMPERRVKEGSGICRWDYTNGLKKNDVIVFRMRGNKEDLDANAVVYIDME